MSCVPSEQLERHPAGAGGAEGGGDRARERPGGRLCRARPEEYERKVRPAGTAGHFLTDF
ncbi:MAG: hypothetical protein PQJ59_14935 [Spirochaetales bacterium]|nr:hypothetical protein [Spirochaetales bacterium]